MTHMCLVDPDEDEACGAELRHGQLSASRATTALLPACLPSQPWLMRTACM